MIIVKKKNRRTTNYGNRDKKVIKSFYIDVGFYPESLYNKDENMR